MYETPPIYLVIHLLIGVISYFYPPLFILFVGYQLLQLVLDIRIFLFSWKIKRGNSIAYTGYKILQGAAGYALTRMRFSEGYAIPRFAL